jgi:hypothetical protein
MTQAAGPDLNKGRSAAALTPQARQVHRAVLAAFTETGRAPARDVLERLAAGPGAGAAAVLAELADCDVIAFDARGRSARPTRSRPYPRRSR